MNPERKTQTLYRFLTADGAIDTLRRRSLRVGRLNKFNDPYEWRPVVHSANGTAESDTVEWVESAFRAMNRRFGLICFSETCREPVLWSQYADRHRGIVIEFDLPCGPSLEKVTYSNERVVLERSTIGNSEHENSNQRKLRDGGVRKSKGWDYEDEWRLTVLLKRTLYCDKSYWLGFEPYYVKRVILGEFCSKTAKNKINRLLECREYCNAFIANEKRSQYTYLVDVK